MVDPNKEHDQKGAELVPFDSPENTEAVMPDEILQPRQQLNERYGEVVYPQDRAGEIVRLSSKAEELRQGQLATLQSLEVGQIPGQFPMHNEVAKKYNEIQMQQFDAMQAIIDAQKKAKLNETKAGNINAAKEVSQFNQERLVGYSKAGAKSVGNVAKYLAIGAGASAYWIAKLGLEVGKVGLDFTKETVKAGKDIWETLFPPDNKDLN